MSTAMGPDWKALAAAQKIEIDDKQRERLEALAKTMLGLRGMIDWSEEPAISFRVDPIEEAGQ
ncbi:MAG: hypothetical protein IPP47_08820 [Bryobacterales bacterium]|jgi:hypothetical protein|nr:hypothetical protein [Bryobacterales bacterium]